MRKKIYITIVSFLFLLLLCSVKSNAAGSIRLSPSKSSVTVGDEFNVSVNLSGASVATLTTRITIDTSKVDYVSGPSNTNFSNGRVIYTWTDPTGGENPKTDGTIATFKFRAKLAGTASFSVSGNFYTPDEKPVNPSFSGTSVTIKEKEQPKPPETQTPPTTGGSSGGTSGGGTTGGTTSGGVNKPSGSTGGSTNQGGSGNTQNKSTNANLKELHLNVEGLSPAFQKTITRYNLVVGDDVSQIAVNAIPEDSNAKVNVTGNTNLKIGTNEVKITVTAQDGKTTKTYVIEVTKTENPELANANLENLAIENVTLEPEFSADIISYNAVIASTQESIHILAVPQIEGATVEITGADNIQFGENIITVKVVAKDGITSKEYTISLYKTTEEEENQNIMPLEEENKEEPQKIGIGHIVFCIIITVSTAGAIFMLVRKYRLENQ